MVRLFSRGMGQRTNSPVQPFLDKTGTYEQQNVLTLMDGQRLRDSGVA